MKKLYEFTIPKNVETEESIKNDDGSKTIKTVLKESLISFAVKKPTRADIDEGELFYHKSYNDYCKVGVQPEILLRKTYGNQDGIFTEKEKRNYVEYYIELGKNLQTITELEDKKELSDEEKNTILNLYKRNKDIQKEIVDYENAKQRFFENSAETLARNKVVFWWLLKLLLEKKGNDYNSIFPSDEKDMLAAHEERCSLYDSINEKIEEEDEEGKFYSKLIERASFLVSLFYMNGAIKPEEFAKLVAQYDERDGNENESSPDA